MNVISCSCIAVLLLRVRIDTYISSTLFFTKSVLSNNSRVPDLVYISIGTLPDLQNILVTSVAVREIETEVTSIEFDLAICLRNPLLLWELFYEAFPDFDFDTVSDCQYFWKSALFRV